MFKNKIIVKGVAMKKLIKNMIPKSIYTLLWILFKRKYTRSYSQSGEDMILNTIFCNTKKGFYVDIGANNPWIQSNTCFFYEKGWNGINIDATPGSMKQFNFRRKRDINLEIPISDTKETLKYYMFEPSFYNTFNAEISMKLKDKLIDTKELNTRKLSLILDNYCPNQEIDFLSIDTEGFDLKILKSNNWDKYRPKIIVIEVHAPVCRCSFKNTEIGKFLEKNNYTFYCNTTVNILFIENTFLKKRFPVTRVSM